MTDRDRLILDITKSDKKTNQKCRYCTDPKGCSTYCAKCSCEQLADNLIADGWIKPPCKVGDIVYAVGMITGQVIPSEVVGIEFTKNDMFLILANQTVVSTVYQIGKTVFLTKEEAEQALEERTGKNE